MGGGTMQPWQRGAGLVQCWDGMVQRIKRGGEAWAAAEMPDAPAVTLLPRVATRGTSVQLLDSSQHASWLQSACRGGGGADEEGSKGNCLYCRKGGRKGTPSAGSKVPLPG